MPKIIKHVPRVGSYFAHLIWGTSGFTNLKTIFIKVKILKASALMLCVKIEHLKEDLKF